MIRLEKSIEIKAPPEKVWEMFAADRWQEWDRAFARVKSVEYISEVNTPEDNFRVSASIRATDNRGREVVQEITESIENEKIVLRSDTFNSTVTYALKPVEAGTEYTIVTDYEFPYGILGGFIGKLFGKRMVEKEAERSMEKLKSILDK